jgi:hypothetical protein
MVTINGKNYKGNNVSVINNEVFIDGKRADQTEDAKVINITIEGSIQELDVDYCDKLEITGDCGSVTSKNGNIQVKGNVSGDVTNKNGNIVCRDVGGDAETKNGDVTHY